MQCAKPIPVADALLQDNALHVLSTLIINILKFCFNHIE